MRNGIVLYPAGAGVWWRLVQVLGRRPARYLRKKGGDRRNYVVLYGDDVRAAASVEGVSRAGLHWSEVTLLPAPGMVERCWADLEAMPQTRESTASCALCGAVVRLADGRLTVHPGMERAADGTRAADCRASRYTPVDAQALAVREAAELDALRMRAHP